MHECNRAACMRRGLALTAGRPAGRTQTSCLHLDSHLVLRHWLRRLPLGSHLTFLCVSVARLPPLDREESKCTQAHKHTNIHTLTFPASRCHEHGECIAITLIYRRSCSYSECLTFSQSEHTERSAHKARRSSKINSPGHTPTSLQHPSTPTLSKPPLSIPHAHRGVNTFQRRLVHFQAQE